MSSIKPLINLSFIEHYAPKAKSELKNHIQLINATLASGELNSKDVRKFESLLNKIGSQFFSRFGKTLKLPDSNDVRFVEKSKIVKDDKGFEGRVHLITKISDERKVFFMEAALAEIYETYFVIDQAESITEQLESYLKGEMYASIWGLEVKGSEIPQELANSAEAALSVAEKFIGPAMFLKQLKSELVELKKKKFAPPVSDTKSYQRVHGLLVAICEELKNELVGYRKLHYLELLRTFMKEAGNKESISKYTYPPRRSGLRQPLTAMVDETRDILQREKATHKVKKGIRGIILKLATKDVLEMQELFVNRNMRKLTSILEAKNNLETADKEYVICDRGSFEGLLKISFKDGSSFKVKHKIVDNVSPLGTYFYQFPTTFHEVILADGSKLKGISESAMNEVFAGVKAKPARKPGLMPQGR